MSKFPDFSADVEELDLWEEYDFDTVDDNPTGINNGRMRLPTRYDISKYYKRQKRHSERGEWKNKDPEDLLDFSDDFDWQITYKFPDRLHPFRTPSGAVYGGKHVTYRRLYLILCEHFNGGDFFIDDYFSTVYPYSAVKKEVDSSLKDLKSVLITGAESYLETAEQMNEEEGLEEMTVSPEGTLDGRYRRNKNAKEMLKAYKEYASEWENTTGRDLAVWIKEDIIDCLATGRIPLNFSLQESTMKRRMEAGLSPRPEFYATARLINSLQLFVNLRSKEWQTSQGIWV